MHWVVLGIIGLTLIVAAGRYPRLAFSMLAVLIVLAVATYKLNSKDDERSDLLLSNADVDLSQVVMTSGYAGSYDMKGILSNRSLVSSLVEVDLEVEMLDCPTETTTPQVDCNSLSFAKARISVEIPPDQDRVFTVNLSFPSSRIEGNTHWIYRISNVIGRPYSR